MPGQPTAIIDIGSNSVRLVVYSGQQRVPIPIFNEKVLAGLGKGVGETGAISDQAWTLAVAELKRFQRLLEHIGVRQVQTIATAAVRDATNGPAFVDEIAALGLPIRIIPSEEEARLAGEGVLSAFADADGIVGDLGGGSLELVRVSDGQTGTGISLPLGVLRIPAAGLDQRTVRSMIRTALEESGLGDAGRGRNLYLVGGSWRALAKIDMMQTAYPLPIAHGYQWQPSRLPELAKALRQALPLRKKISAPRLASAPVAAMLLGELVALLRPRSLIVSELGIREGLLYSQFGSAERELDPLIEAARDAGGADRRFGEHGAILDRWIAPLFDDPPETRRIRLATCLLADSAWQANAEFRADRGIETALHGNWIGITAEQRVMMAQALSSSFGRDRLPDQRITCLCAPEQLSRAEQWGLAIRLAQRLSAGVGSILEQTALELAGGCVRLILARREQVLLSEAVSKRLSRLATALQRSPEVVVA